MNGATARIILRYLVGAVIGAEAAEALAGDPDLVLVIATVVGAATEVVYAQAKKRGWTL